jgi:alcohol dehydrogenase, propanol-preferring
MKAAILREFRAPLTIEEVATPKLEIHEVLIEVEACGVCHSDLHVADGDWPQIVPITKRPLILGHEIAGRVVEKGSAVTDLALGDRVGVAWVHWTCGECGFCREGNENLCVKQKITGVTVDGGYAEFIKAPASHALKIPDGLSCVEAAPLFCAGSRCTGPCGGPRSRPDSAWQFLESVGSDIWRCKLVTVWEQW